MSNFAPSAQVALRQSPAVPAEPIWRLSLDQYHAMIRAGILTDDDPVELLEGWLVLKQPKNPSHRLTTGLTREALERVTPTGWYVDAHEPITLQNSEPEPDVVVVRGQTRDYLDRHPRPQDLALVVEVADASLQRDRTTKKRLYAAAGIPVYGIVNLPDRQVEVYTDPTGPAEQPDYRQRQDRDRTGEVPLLLGGKEVGRVAVRELLP
jgi:Uma2 family endonuclease